MSNDMAGMDEPVLDPFDPQTTAAVEAHEAELKQLGVDQLSAYIRRRQVAYAKVFGNLEDPDVLFVLEDLAAFSRAFTSAFDANDRVHALKEGRREVFYRIVDSTRLSHDTMYRLLYEKVVAATAARRT